ncbi:MAG TPA: histidine kinase dimerization/phosphoacceptor domain -containing protein [Stenomitos sp.]
MRIGNHPLPKIPLRNLLALSSLLQVFAAVSITGGLSFHYGQQAVRQLASRLRTEVTQHTISHLDHYLSTPNQINHINLAASRDGLLNLNDFQRTGRYFWQQMQVFEVGYINYANAQGEFIGVERLDNGQLLINETRRPHIKAMDIYQTNHRGDRTRQIGQEVSQNPVQAEGWFADAAKAKKPVWSNIYQWEDKPTVLSISASHPIYDQQKQLVGVLGVDLILSQIGEFLRATQVSPSGSTFILERNGFLVANSGSELPFKQVQGRAHRLKGRESPNPLIRSTTQYLEQRFQNLQKLQSVQQLAFRNGNQKLFVQATPWHDPYGLDWLIVVVVPESDVMGKIDANLNLTIAACGGVLIISTIAALITARKIAAPIMQLQTAAKAIAAGELNQTVTAESIQEFHTLSLAFNQMAKKLEMAFQTLATTNEILEQRVEARTTELKLSEQRFAQFFHFSPAPILIETQEDTKILDVNSSFCQLFGYSKEEAVGQPTEMILEVHPASSPYSPTVPLLMPETLRCQEVELRTQYGDTKTIELFTEAIEVNGQACKIYVANDITERRRAESELRRKHRELETLFEALPDLVFHLSANDVIVDYKAHCDADLYAPPEQFLGQPFQAVMPEPVSEVLQRAIARVRETHTLVTVEYQLGEQDYEARIVPHLEGQIMAIVRNISDRKRAEAQIQSSLHEKEVLLKEIHHRVKNNLYVISNLLDLQSDTIEDPQLLSLFSDSQLRIQAMALIHEQLYQSDNLGKIDFADYLHRLINNLFFSFGEEVGDVHPILDVEPLILNIETAIPCGLIVNELVTNAFKHAFPNGRSGEVHIRLFLDSASKLHLILTDNGIGLPPNLDWENTPSLGLRLVRILSQQLRATLSVTSAPGTTLELVFSQLQYQSRF